MNAIVHIVDDDISVLTALGRSLRADGLDVSLSRTTEEFLASYDPAVGGCVVLDLHMPGMDGLQLQQLLFQRGQRTPLIFVSGSADVPSCASAMRAGAIDFLTKPVNDKDLFEAVSRAEARDTESRRLHSEMELIEAKVSTLTPREREVLTHVVAGQLNKQIAGDLGTVEKTIKVHRSRMMEKLGIRSVADLVRMTEKLNLSK